MTFEYNPADVKSDYIVLPVGEYECEIMSATQTVSKQGNDMIKLVNCVYGNDDEKVRVYDYIVPPQSLYKLKSICRCCDLAFDGIMDEQLLVGKRMKVKVTVEPAKDQYPERNSIVKYVSGLGNQQTVNDPPVVADSNPMPKDDDIPF